MKKGILFFLFFYFFNSYLFAHFQLIYTQESALKNGKKIELKEVFTHPFTDEYTMDMEGVEEFYVVNKGKKTDLIKTLEPITFQGNNDKGKAYSSKYKASRMGDHLFVLVPKPYYDKISDEYIQQYTKMVLNVAGPPSDWDTELKLDAEIVPLTKPYAIWTNSNFTGIVKQKGKPVPYAKVYVEYLNRDVDTKNNKMGPSKIEAPQGSFLSLEIKANKDGEFTFSIPKAGWWGFCAKEVGAKKEYKGKKLTQDSVIWVQAKDMK
ncbi:nickel transporter [Halarcobacter ebronensis]|uniref:Nickel transporter n=1 Tax=Halarcobacter ebronensis TaxID=1462615 RepID=A0A4Q0YII2_9BACT|nr:DUF4198 domain-containing protein [Halarcobacter ebronensis]RXJ68899.1 nickel transporter [Halarcobacter ebronensis]